MEDMKDWIVGFMLTSLFIVCILSFAVGFGALYGKSQEDMITDKFHIAVFNQSLVNAQSSSSSWAETLKSDNIIVVLGGLVIKSIWTIGKSVGTVIIGMFGLYNDVILSIFGVPPIVTDTITSLLVIVIVFLIWRLIKQGW